MAFGSYSEQTGRECEGLQLGDSHWETLPKMHKSRYSFTPALWLEAVYLCGGWNRTVEVFDGVSMRLLDISLPEGTGSMACAYGNKLLVFTRKYFVTLSKLENDQEFDVSVKRRESEGTHSFASPIQWNGVMICFGYPLPQGPERIYKYSTENGNSLD